MTFKVYSNNGGGNDLAFEHVARIHYDNTPVMDTIKHCIKEWGVEGEVSVYVEDVLICYI